ncbi:MAG: hypothetical protein QOD42_3807 [Sphingomonadales bacterium]|jgi:hypothetical protein|nr:hypothetical protein [Sphingomonadales bacterium]
MKIARAMLTAAALVLTTGVAAGAGTEADASLSPAQEDQASAAAPGAALDRAFVIGRWGPDAACSQIVEFHADGSVTPPQGSSWTMTGNRLTMSLPGRPVVTTTLTRINDNEMTATRLDGSTFTMFRCR